MAYVSSTTHEDASDWPSLDDPPAETTHEPNYSRTPLTNQTTAERHSVTAAAGTDPQAFTTPATNRRA